MEENVKVRSWGAIVVAFILFWPLGLYWYIKRLNINRNDALNSWKVMLGFGIWFTFLGLSTAGVGVGVPYLIGGIILLVSAIVHKSNAKKTKKYLSIIINGGVTQIVNIASSTGKSVDTVRADIQKMIDKRFLKAGTYIDASTDEVKIPNMSGSAASTPENASIPPKTVVCKCCGANNTVTSAASVCEYCGSAL